MNCLPNSFRERSSDLILSYPEPASPRPVTSAVSSLPPALSLSCTLVRLISLMGQIADSQMGRSRMWPPSPSAPMAMPTPVSERSRRSSSVFDEMSVPIIAHATRPIAPSMHVFDRSTRAGSLPVLEPFSSGTGSRTTDWPPALEALTMSS